MRSLILVAMVVHGMVVLGGRACFKVFVQDSETGMPLSGVKIEGSFLNYPKGWGIAAKNNDIDAWTDSRGYATLSGGTEQGVGGYRIYRTMGYYNAEWVEITFQERSVLRLGAWQPSGIVSTARLDRVVNPIPLYVKKAVGEYRKKNPAYHKIYENQQGLSATNDVPIVKDESMAYDLVKGAWMPPHGDGESADIQVLFNETVLGWKEGGGYSGTSMTKKYRMAMAISLPGEGNGIVEVSVNNGAGIQVREAPSDGYSPYTSRWIGWFGGGDGTKTDCDKTRCYAFRIRTKYDDEGNVKTAYYGKIYGDFNMQDVDGVEFLYYLNPTPNDRNLEWDMRNNLCPKPGDVGNPQP